MAYLIFVTRRCLIVKDPNDPALCRRSRAHAFHQPLISSTLRADLVEVSGLEPLTPCLQSRCSSS